MCNRLIGVRCTMSLFIYYMYLFSYGFTYLVVDLVWPEKRGKKKKEKILKTGKGFFSDSVMSVSSLVLSIYLNAMHKLW